ncbi:MAG TPA: DUF3307 domain-containing protein [Anaerolineae bacterium]|nr:DUF3307 domain-containing protein [Anaerolineae bacterium]
MSLFDWLLVGHLVGDFLLQTDRMARYKAREWRWMLTHVGVYMAAVTLAALLYAWQHPLSPWPAVVGLFLVAATHVGLDRRNFTAWWMRSMGVSPDKPWLAIIIDQVFHVLVLVIAAQVLLVGSPGSV